MHAILDDWTLFSAVADETALEGRHTGEAIAMQQLALGGIDIKAPRFATSDNAANQVRFC